MLLGKKLYKKKTSKFNLRHAINSSPHQTQYARAVCSVVVTFHRRGCIFTQPCFCFIVSVLLIQDLGVVLKKKVAIVQLLSLKLFKLVIKA